MIDHKTTSDWFKNADGRKIKLELRFQHKNVRMGGSAGLVWNAGEGSTDDDHNDESEWIVAEAFDDQYWGGHTVYLREFRENDKEGSHIGSFAIRQFPCCCGVLLMCALSLVDTRTHDQEIVLQYRKLREKFARELKFSAIVLADNPRSNSNPGYYGYWRKKEIAEWTDKNTSGEFNNRRSGMDIHIGWVFV